MTYITVRYPTPANPYQNTPSTGTVEATRQEDPMTTTTHGHVKTVHITTPECHARMAEIEAQLSRMGLTMDEARAHQAQYRLTEAQYRLVSEYDDLVWLAG